MFTFILLALAIIVLAILLDQIVYRTRVIFTKHVIRVAGMLAVVTIVFDNILSILPVYVFDHSKTLGVFLPWAPIEDIVYIIGIVFFVATIDAHLKTRPNESTK